MKPVSEMTDAELHAAWEAGMYFDSVSETPMTPEQDARHREIEREMDRRETSEKHSPAPEATTAPE